MRCGRWRAASRGPIAAALETPACWYGLIVDGVHVDPAMLRLALRGLGSPMLVTDAMPPVGGSRATFRALRQGDLGRATTAASRTDGTLAGAFLDMATRGAQLRAPARAFARTGVVPRLGQSRVLSRVSRVGQACSRLPRRYGCARSRDRSRWSGPGSRASKRRMHDPIIALTGATGFIGNHLLHALTRAAIGSAFCCAARPRCRRAAPTP